MSLFDEDIDTVTVKDPIPVIAKPEFKTNVVDTEYTPRANLIIEMRGYAWDVNYFSQVLGEHDELSGLSAGKNAIHQQYRLIEQFELRVDSPLTSSQNPETNSMIVSGTAHVHPVLIPNVGDVFIADIGDGREGIFEIISAERLSKFKETVHRIEYRLKDYLTGTLRFDLYSKIVKRLHFRREFLDYGQSPLIEASQVQYVRDLEEHYRRLSDGYIRAHYSNEYSTILVPGQTTPAYDPYVTSMVFGLYSSTETPDLQKIKRLNVDDDEVFRARTIFDALLERDPAILHTAVREVGLVAARSFSRNPLLYGIFYSGIRDVVYPSDGTFTIDYQTKDRTKPVTAAALENHNFRAEPLAGFLDESDLTDFPYATTTLIHPVMTDSYYVLSKAFYDGTPEAQSILELQISDYLKGKSPNSQVLLHLVNSMPYWGSLERFYYTPLVLILIHANLRNL